MTGEFLKELLSLQARIIQAPVHAGGPFCVCLPHATSKQIEQLGAIHAQITEQGAYLTLFESRLPDNSDAQAMRRALQNYQEKQFQVLLPKRRAVVGPKPVIQAILNLTPDSFFPGSRTADLAQAMQRVDKFVAKGADWIDVGGESTRPGAQPVSAEEELARVIPAIREIKKQHPQIVVSMDTMKSQVAQQAVDAGAEIINDVSGLRWDPNMAKVAAQTKAGLILMHMRGTPQTMQKDPYYKDLIGEIAQELLQSVERGLRHGIEANRIILDPGIGFGKRVEQNLEILRRLSEFRSFGFPLLLGVSRKSFVDSALGKRSPEDRLWGTAAAVSAAVLAGARILRVHDVTEMKDVAKTAQSIAEGISCSPS